MDSIVILLSILVIMSFLFNNFSQENFVQVKSDRNINKNSSIIKPIQVSPGYNQTVKIYDRDDPVSNPYYNPNIFPSLINSSANLNLPGQSNGSFEQSDNKNNKQSNGKNASLFTSKNSNPKAIRPDSGHLIRPIELDSTPSSNTQVKKPYLNKDFPQAYSEYLEYTNVSEQEPSDCGAGIFSDQEQSSQCMPNNKKMKISSLMLKSIKTENEKILSVDNLSNEDIIKRIIKRAAELSIESTNNINFLSSMKKANYSVGYLNMLRDIMPDSEISNLANVNLYKFAEELEKNQKFNIEKMTLKCSNMSADKKYLFEIATKL